MDLMSPVTWAKSPLAHLTYITQAFRHLSHQRLFRKPVPISAIDAHSRRKFGGPSLAPHRIYQSLSILTCWNADHAQRFQTRRKKA